MVKMIRAVPEVPFGNTEADAPEEAVQDYIALGWKVADKKESKPEVKSEPNPEVKTEVKAEAKPEVKTEDKKASKK